MGYLAYLLLVGLGVGHILAMTLLYILASITGFLANKRWTFAHRGSIPGSALRYVGMQIGGYFINLGMLLVFADGLGYPHQLVQGVAIFVVAGFLFLTLKAFVFHKVGPT